MATVDLIGVHKRFGDVQIVRGVDLHVPDGSFVVLVGGSGCGKSTLLRMIAGLESPSEGTIRMDGADVTTVSPRDRDVAMVFQSYALYPHMSVRQNMGFGLKVRGADPATVEAAVADAAKILAIEHLLDRRPAALSGGQRQRVAMGRALVRRPRLFLFDEPLSNLDAALRGQMRVELKRLHQKLGVTTIYVTHDQIEAMTLADQIALMNAGQIEQIGPPRLLYDWPASRYVAAFLGSPHMNFLPATCEGRRVRAAGVNVTVDARHLALQPQAIAVDLGVRPHDLSLRASPGDGTIEAVVDVLEPMGWETLAHVRVGETLWTARLDTEEAVALRPGRTVHLAVDPANVRLFDPTTGAALCHPPDDGHLHTVSEVA